MRNSRLHAIAPVFQTVSSLSAVTAGDRHLEQRPERRNRTVSGEVERSVSCLAVASLRWSVRDGEIPYAADPTLRT
jgi:hypothetical protein